MNECRKLKVGYAGIMEADRRQARPRRLLAHVRMSVLGASWGGVRFV